MKVDLEGSKGCCLLVSVHATTLHGSGVGVQLDGAACARETLPLCLLQRPKRLTITPQHGILNHSYLGDSRTLNTKACTIGADTVASETLIS